MRKILGAFFLLLCISSSLLASSEEIENNSITLNELSSQARAGDRKAQYELGLRYYNGQGVRQDYEEAVAWFRNAAEQGEVKAQYYLGVMYEKGQGVGQDYALAVNWYRKAADHGDVASQCNLGVIYAKGRGVTKNYSEGIVWLKKAAERGETNAQRNLGIMYTQGQGVPKDYAKAIVWFKKAADQGDLSSYCCLGLAYQLGLGVKRDYQEAIRYYSIAAASVNGVGLAQYELGGIYYYGRGVPQDYTKAYLLWDLASRKGLIKAKAYRIFLAIMMTPLQREEAKEMAMVTNVPSGDRITVLHSGFEENIRLWGIDSPGKGHAFAEQATQFNSEFVQHKIVQIIPKAVDHSGQTVADVFFEGTSLNGELVKAGLAQVNRTYCTSGSCSKWIELEQEAQKSHIGQWLQPPQEAPKENKPAVRMPYYDLKKEPQSLIKLLIDGIYFIPLLIIAIAFILPGRYIIKKGNVRRGMVLIGVLLILLSLSYVIPSKPLGLKILCIAGIVWIYNIYYAIKIAYRLKKLRTRACNSPEDLLVTLKNNALKPDFIFEVHISLWFPIVTATVLFVLFAYFFKVFISKADILHSLLTLLLLSFFGLILLRAIPLISRPGLILSRDGIKTVWHGFIPWHEIQGISYKKRKLNFVTTRLLILYVTNIALYLGNFNFAERIFHHLLRYGKSKKCIPLSLNGSSVEPEVIYAIARRLWEQSTGRGYDWDSDLSEDANEAIRRVHEYANQKIPITVASQNTIMKDDMILIAKARKRQRILIWLIPIMSVLIYLLAHMFL